MGLKAGGGGEGEERGKGEERGNETHGNTYIFIRKQVKICLILLR